MERSASTAPRSSHGDTTGTAAPWLRSRPRRHDEAVSDWLSTGAAANRIGVGVRTLYRLIDHGELPAYRFGRVIRLRAVEVDQFIDRSRIPAGRQ